MPYICKYFSVVGEITITSDGESITGLWLEGQKYFPDFLGEHKENKGLKVFKDTIKWLEHYFQGRKPDFDLPIKLEGTTFRKEVWEILSEIPYGKTITYGDIAEKLAKKKGIKKMSARGVGGAVGHNPISIIIPCHRVIGANGDLTGYAGGIDKKVKLLELEGWKKEIIEKLTHLLNIGPALEKQLNAVGIFTFSDLDGIGSIGAWLKIQRIDRSACYNRLLSLEGALQQISKKDLSEEDKKRLKDFYSSHKK